MIGGIVPENWFWAWIIYTVWTNHSTLYVMALGLWPLTTVLFILNWRWRP